MANKMLIDATHPEETRVVVLRGNRVEEFDFEAASRKQLRGNIYLAKVTRVEPSLQAAFVDYGGNRHGFLAFSEIHPDYYQIPVADRQALLEEERLRRGPDDDFEPADDTTDDAELEEIEEAEAYEFEEVTGGGLGNAVEEQFPPEGRDENDGDGDGENDDDGDGENDDDGDGEEDSDRPGAERSLAAAGDDDAVISGEPPFEESDRPAGTGNGDEPAAGAAEEVGPGEAAADATEPAAKQRARKDGGEVRKPRRKRTRAKKSDDEAPAQEAGPRKPRRQYKIQEVIKRRQILLVQVVKEERGTKGAALTTYLSLAGRYSVLMPNSARGGGISRKITNPTDRKRLKQIAGELPVPEGMGVILRTAGASRTKTEIKRDFEYLMRLWENVRDLTLKSSAPTLVYEEGNLVKRSIRDLYNKDIDEVLVAGDTGYREAKDFMRMLMPSHAKNVQPYRDKVPIFAKYRVEPQLDAMFLPQVTLPSGGYVVINQTEALVAVDVNSGKATREHNIEDTALRTNVEAAEEIARQLRLRDLAGLIVIDFIDMEEKRNNRTVERKLKDCLKTDRARIQVGRISHFGLLEMSRQRLRTGVLESSTELCPHCHGTGVIRSTESVALHVLRAIEDQLLRNASHNLNVRIRTDVALYIINHKRHSLNDIEDRYGIQLSLVADETIEEAYCIIERNGLAEARRPQPGAGVPDTVQPDSIELDEITEETAETAETADEDSDEGRRKRRRRRRRRGRDGEGGSRSEFAEDARADEEAGEDDDEGDEDEAAAAQADGEDRDDGSSRKRRRGRRGGRRSKRVTAPEEGMSAGGEEEPRTAGEAEVPAGEDRRDEPAEPVAGAAEEASTIEQEEAPAAETAAEPEVEAEPEAQPEAITPPEEAAPDTEEEAVTETAAEPEAEGEPEAQPGAARPSEGAAPASEAPSDAADQPAEPAQPAEEEERRPRRSGWWQRRGFFRPE